MSRTLVRVCRASLTPEQVRTAERMQAEGQPVKAIAAALGVKATTFHEMKGYGCLSHLPRRQGCGGGRSRNNLSAQDREPTAAEVAEIQARTMQVQQRWTAEERMLRRVGGFPPGVAKYTVKVQDIGLQDLWR